MQSYIIKSTIRYNRIFFDRFSALVDAVPYDGMPSREAEYRLQLRRFLMHLDHCANYNRKVSPDEWTPIPYELGKRELPMLFGRHRDKATKGMLWLTQNREHALVEVKLGSFVSGHCNEYRLKRDVRIGLYKDLRNPDEASSFEEFKKTQRLYDISKPLADQRPITWDRVIKKALERGLTEPRHDTSHLRNFRKARVRYKAAYAKLQPHVLNLDNMLYLLWLMQQSEPLVNGDLAESYKINHLAQMTRGMETIFARGIVMVESENNQRLIAYKPEYRVALIGGRGFEIGGGFQTLPGWVKNLVSMGINYDIRNSQMSILQNQFDQRRISCDFLHNRDLSSLCVFFDIPRSIMKSLFYGLVFNAGRRVAYTHNASYHALLKGTNMRQEHAQMIIEHWNSATDELSNALKELNEQLWNERTNTKCLTWGNPTGIPFQARRKTFSTRKQLLAHTIQGIETDFILKALENDANRVCALEHDGCIGRVEEKPESFLQMPMKTDQISHRLQTLMMYESNSYWRLLQHERRLDEPENYR